MASSRRVASLVGPADVPNKATTHGLKWVEYKSADEISELAASWNALINESPLASIFSGWEWLGAWYSSYGRRAQLLVVAFFESEDLVGIAPMMVQVRTFGVRLRFLQLLGDGSEDSDNLDILAKPQYERRVALAFFEYLQSIRRKWDVAELNTTPSGSVVIEELVCAVHKIRCPFHSCAIPCTVVALPKTWNDYLSQLSPKERAKIGYSHRRLESKYDVVIRRCETPEDLPHFLDFLYILHSKRWRTKNDAGSFESPRRRTFYALMSREFLRRGWLEFWLLELNGRPVASQFGFKLKDRFYALQEGFDPDYSVDSVGFVLRASVFQRLIETGTRYYDFLAGVNESKLRWGGTVSNYLNVSFALRGTKGAAYLKYCEIRDNAKRWARKHIPMNLRKNVPRFLRKI